MSERQPDGQWCWCPDPPEGQPPHDCAEDHPGRPAHQHDGAHVHPWPRPPLGRPDPSAPAWMLDVAEDVMARRLGYLEDAMIARGEDITNDGLRRLRLSQLDSLLSSGRVLAVRRGGRRS